MSNFWGPLQQAPFQFTGDVRVDWYIFIVGVVVCLYWLRALRLAREGARAFLRNLAKAALVFCALSVVLGAFRLQTHLQPVQEQLAAALVAVLFFGRFQSRKRSRYIPRATRRVVIARDLKGEKYDSRKHHIDHVWPFSKGGSNTVDNLRVIEKRKNIRKGARRPRIHEMW